MKKILREYKSDKIQAQLDKRDRSQNLWPHHPDKLLISSVEYFVKFYGSTGVNASQGDEMIKGAIQHLTHMSNAGSPQTGTAKPPRIYLNISADKITIRESKIRVEVDRFNISEISYVADDRAVKRVVALIVANKGNKERKSTETDRDHQSPFKCYLFESEKYAEEIVRTIGQAFDLGYRNFLASDKREMQIKSQLKQMSLKIKQLEGLNDQYSQRIALLESILKFNKIDFPKSSLVAKVQKPSDVTTKPPLEKQQSHGSATGMLLEFDASTSGTVDANPPAGKTENKVAIPSLKPPPVPNRPREPVKPSEPAKSPQSPSATSKTKGATLLDLAIQPTEQNMYMETGERGPVDDDFALLALNRLNSVGSDNGHVNIPSNDQQGSFGLDYLNTNQQDNGVYSPESAPSTAYVNPFQSHNYGNLYPSLQTATTVSPNMPDLGSGLYYNALAATSPTEGELDSAARTLLDLGIDESLFAPPGISFESGSNEVDHIYSVPN
ncbi:uncharacterized protein LOC142336036 isoform X2 [Convolutriloba macropyga]|uniref:uncharacterized protein LOC142336036 isoform X2 n=1 Tax=Convolutriloba macropyga TaxID=536237 RepID=UPI003F526674